MNFSLLEERIEQSEDVAFFFIENSPLEIDETGDLITDDYEGALAALRSWLNQNPDYTIRTDTYCVFVGGLFSTPSP